MQSLRAARRGSQKLDMMWNFGPHLGNLGKRFTPTPWAKCCFPTQSSHRHGSFHPCRGGKGKDTEEYGTGLFTSSLYFLKFCFFFFFLLEKSNKSMKRYKKQISHFLDAV